MRAVVQRVRCADVTVAGRTVAKVGQGLLVYLGVAKGDTQEEASWLVDKVAGLRIFPNEDGKFDRSVEDEGGSVLVVSQFTLLGDASRGRRPSFHRAAPHETARPLYELFADLMAARGLEVQRGAFGEHMMVTSEGDGPVTLFVERR